jgi:imidazolonepropionase-like amidohydrolase
MQIAIRLAKEFDLDMFFIHASGLDRMVEETAESGYPISLGPCFTGMGREHRRWRAAVRFAELGGKVTIQQDHPDGPQFYIRHAAAMLVRHGMSKEEALKTITLNSAEIFHLEDRIGSLEVGKDADFLIMSGEPLEIDTHVEQTFIEGREVYNRATGFCVFE